MLKFDDRVLILAPHPDDEVLGCGGIILRCIKMRIPLKIVFFTYGDSNEWAFLRYRKFPVITPTQIQRMGLLRHQEAIEAAKILGLSTDHLIFLGYPDFGTLRIWYHRWRNQLPLLNPLTEVRSVPYVNAFRPDALYKGEDILIDLKEIIRNFRPTKIFLSHRNDFNGDHQALYLFTRVVLWDLEKEIHPEIYSYLVHFDKWPYPREHLLVPLTPPKSLEGKIQWRKFTLTEDEISTKYNALKAHKSQFQTNKRYLLSFIRNNELFGDFGELSADEIRHTPHLETNSMSSIISSSELSEDEREVYLSIKHHIFSLKDDNLILSVNISKVIHLKNDGLGEKIVHGVTDGVHRVTHLMPRKVANFVSENINDLLPTIKEGVLPVTIPSIFPKNVGVAFYIFGYRYDRPFGEMPKIWIRIGRKGYTIYDLTQEVPESVEVIRESPNLQVTVPLKILDAPDLILLNIRNYIGTITLDWIPWYIIKLN